ncbi:MAG: MmcQ/YjbR family DNA-binding protein [Chloroflexota bacterium]|nr:MAG: MmcQ-like protein [Chloroflexota bacterium]
MTLDELRALLMGRPGASEDFPFGPEPLVAKVGGRMFALVSFRRPPLQISLKCDPYHAQLLRDTYPAVRPGYHLNKRHWITVTLDGSLPEELLRSLIDESYALVVRGLTRAARRALEGEPT